MARGDPLTPRILSPDHIPCPRGAIFPLFPKKSIKNHIPEKTCFESQSGDEDDRNQKNDRDHDFNQILPKYQS